MCGTELDATEAGAHIGCMKLYSPRLLPCRNARALSLCGGLALAALGAGALGCGSGGQTGDEQTAGSGGQAGDGQGGDHGRILQQLRGTAERVPATGNLPNSASADTWAFGWKLYREEAGPSENVFFSPYSIS